jgi:drug/metabolite transporter (DMT)-like permease
VVIGVAAALWAALGWTLASSLWRRLPPSLGAARLNLLKNLLALALLAVPLALVVGAPGLSALPGTGLALLAASGVLGIAAGDSLFFAALRRLGTRRTLTVEAGGPALTAAAAALLLGEALGPQQWAGIGLISVALVLVARQGSPAAVGAAGPPAAAGLLLAAAAMVCGSAGALLARAALQGGAISPLAATGLRLAAASLVMLPLLPGLVRRWRRPAGACARSTGSMRSLWGLVLLATLLGTVGGIALQQVALSRLPAGLAVSLLATAPVMAVLLAPLEGDRPLLSGWLAALAALAGVVLLVS